MAKDFLGFIASVEGTEALTAAQSPPSGPYVINGSSLPADVLPAVKDIQAYLDANAAAPALEFLSPVKGPALEQTHGRRRHRSVHRRGGGRAVRSGRGEGGASSSACRAGSSETTWARSRPAASPPAARARRAPRDERARRASVLGAYPYWFYLPAAIVFGIIFIVPTVLAFYYSLTRWTLFDAEFIGLDNFAQFFREPALRAGCATRSSTPSSRAGSRSSSGCCWRRCSPRGSTSATCCGR